MTTGLFLQPRRDSLARFAIIFLLGIISKFSYQDDTLINSLVIMKA